MKEKNQKLWVVNLESEVEQLEVTKIAEHLYCEDAGFISEIGEAFFENEIDALRQAEKEIIEKIKKLEACQEKIQKRIKEAG